VRHAAEFSERDDERDATDNEQQRLARDEQQDSRAQNQGHHQISKNCQRKFHCGRL
jgi:hypothetical protein